MCDPFCFFGQTLERFPYFTWRPSFIQFKWSKQMGVSSECVERGGGISPLFMKECSVNIVIVGFIAVITLFFICLCFCLFWGFLSVWRCDESLLSFCVIISPRSENSGVVWRANWPLCHSHCASIWRVAHFGTYMYGKERDRPEGLCKTWRPKRKSREMRSFLPDFQIKQRTTAERAMIHSVVFNQPQMYFMHMRTFLLTKASACSDGWLTSKGGGERLQDSKPC